MLVTQPMLPPHCPPKIRLWMGIGAVDQPDLTGSSDSGLVDQVKSILLYA